MRGEVDPIGVGQLCSTLRRLRPDVVHMHTSHAHTLGVIASLLTGIGRRIVSRRVDFSIHRHRFGLSSFKYRRGVDRYIAISRAVRAALVEDGIPEERISLVYSGVDPSRFVGGDGRKAREELRVEPHAPLVGTVAHFGWHKSIETLIAAAEHIIAAVPEAVIAIIGDGDLRPGLEAERERSPVRDRIVMPGFRDNVADYLRAFDVFTMPSVMEGLCTSILDAFAVRVPVAACAAGGIPELVEDGVTGLLCEPRNPRALAQVIIRLLKDRALARNLAEGGHRKVLSSFTHDSMVDGTIAVYRDVLDRVSHANGRAGTP